MKVSKKEKSGYSRDMVYGFVNILDLEKAQQVRLGIDFFKELLEIVVSLEKIGFDELVLTVEKNSPIVIGSLEGGIALAPRIREDIDGPHPNL